MDRLDLSAVTVRAFYGQPMPGLAATDLGPGVNVVYGPNGQGKTTLARAIHGVLWPETVAAQRPTYTAAFHYAGDDWTVEFDAGVPRYQRADRPADRLPLPDASYRDRYELSLKDLLLADGDAFADVVRRDAAGGVDLDQARDRLGFKAAPTQRLKITAEAEEAARGVQRRQHQLDALRAREQALGEIADRAAEATDAADLADLYRLLDDAHDRADAADAADRVVAGFADALANVAADTQERYDDHAIAVRKAESRRADVEADRTQARAALAEHGWDEANLPETAEIESRAREVEAATRALEAAERARAAASERERIARETLGGHIEVAPRVDVAALGDVAEFARQSGAARGRREELNARLLAAKSRLNAVRFHDADELHRAADLLRRWLAHTVEAESRPKGLGPTPVWIGAAVLAVAAVALALLVAPGAWWLLLGAAALAAVAVALGKKQEAVASPADAAREAFGALSVAPPADWSPAVVQKKLSLVERDALDQKEREMWQASISEIERTLLAVDSDNQELDARRRSLGEALGLDVPDAPETLHLLSRNVLAWQSAARDLGVADAARDQARGALQTSLDLLNHVLDGLPVEPAVDAASAAGVVSRVSREATERERLRGQVARLDQAAGAATERLHEAEAARDAFLARLGLQEPAAEGVASLVSAYPAYTAAVAEQARARAVAEEAVTRARSHPRFTAEAGEMDRPSLTAARSAAQARAARRDEWLEEKASIQALVGEARRASALAAAHAEHGRALDALEASYHTQADALVGHALAEFVAEETRDQHLPVVFKRAREVLAEITDDRFRLDFDGEAGTFRAFDAVRGRAYGLDELSSGTRLQLLLAVRLAFAEQQEVGVRLPILLDEALANSDDERAGAIVQAVLRLCRQGRQVFYFTAQAEEVAKWRRLADEHPDVECRFVGLPSTAALVEVDVQATPADETTKRVPEADGMGMSEYAGAAGVAPWTGWDAIESLHVWYLLDTPAEVQACLRRGYAAWGQLASAHERGKAVPVADFDRVARRAQAVRAWQQAWRQGRGAKVDRAVLEATDAVTDAFIDEVDALCGDCDGDAQGLLDCLERGDVARFQGRQLERLEAFLTDGGYLSPDARLSDSEIRRRVAEAVPHPDAIEDAFDVLARVRQRAEAVGT